MISFDQPLWCCRVLAEDLCRPGQQALPRQCCSSWRSAEGVAVPPTSHPRSWRDHRLSVHRGCAGADRALHRRIQSHRRRRRHPRNHDVAPRDAARWRRAASVAVEDPVVAARVEGNARSEVPRRKADFRNGAEGSEVLGGEREERRFPSPSRMVAGGAFLAAQTVEQFVEPHKQKSNAVRSVDCNSVILVAIQNQTHIRINCLS